MGNIIDLEEQRSKRQNKETEVSNANNPSYLLDLVEFIITGKITDIYGVAVLSDSKHYAIAPENFTIFSDFKAKMNEVIENLERRK